MNLDLQKTVLYWFEGAVYDIGVSEAMFKADKYPYALFMGHLALEKILKALVVRITKTHAPITHSLPYLAEKTLLPIPESILIQLREYMEFHIEARYPREQAAFYKKCTKTYTSEKLHKINEVFQWYQKELSKL